MSLDLAAKIRKHIAFLHAEHERDVNKLSRQHEALRIKYRELQKKNNRLHQQISKLKRQNELHKQTLIAIDNSLNEKGEIKRVGTPNVPSIGDELSKLDLLHPAKFPTMQEFINNYTTEKKES